ncbi:MAG: hypothetical protein IJX98_03005 [Clostridia bacterium]|nr:hypothetical protein [Clostridia bacterium]
MKEQVQTEEFSLLDLLKALLSKIKLLILVFLIGGILGGVIGVFTSVNVKYYGTNLEFYVNPKESISSDSSSTYGVYGAYGRNVMDNMVKLLNSESFAEELMVGMENAPSEKTNTSGKINEDYKNFLYLVKNSVSFSYIEEDDDTDDAANLARSFIYVKISVLGNEYVDFAEDLLTQVRTKVPDYVEEKMIVPTGYEGTDCNEITTVSEITHTNPGYTEETAIKYGIVLAAVALIVTCIVVIIVDRSDKRLRDYEAVAKQLDIPVLGVVPTIEEGTIKIGEEQQGGNEQ